MIPYVLVPPSPWSPRKRKPSRSPSPADSSRASSLTLSPKKRTRVSGDVDVATSRLSKISFETAHASGSRQFSPTISDIIFDEDEETSGQTSRETILSDYREIDSSGTSTSDVVFEYDEDAEYVPEHQLSNKLGETPGQGIPIRRLLDFALFKCDGHLLINPLQLLDSDLAGMYGATGVVKSVSAEDSDDESVDSDEGGDDGHRVRLLEIIEFDVHHFANGEVDENIYVKTAKAWYILDTASSIYKAFWTPFCLLHGFAHRVMTQAFDNPRVTYPEFLESLGSDESESAFKSDEVVAYVMQAVEDVVSQYAPIARVPFIRSLIDQPAPVLPPLEQRSKRAHRKAVEEDATTYLTPMVDRIVTKYLISPVAVLGAELDRIDEKLATELEEVLVHHEDPKSMHWGSKLNDLYYSSIVMDNATYRIGDVVAVAPGADSNAEREESEQAAATFCVNAYANRAWFIQIKYFFEEKGQKMFHGQWFTHGSRTLLQEVTHSQELFVLPECDNISVATIYQKCQVRFLTPDEVEEPDSCDAQARNYFYRLAYDDKSHDFTDLPCDGECRRLAALFTEHRYCTCCARKAEEELSHTVQVIGDKAHGYGLTQHNVEYHEGDFVYVRPAVAAKKELVLFIAQITKVKQREKALCVRYYERYIDDERRLCRTNRRNDVSVGDLDGVCFVRHLDPDDSAEQDQIEPWIGAHSDHFYTNERKTVNGLDTVTKEDFDWCSKCFDQHCEELENHYRFVLRKGKVSVCEVFAGAGGLCQGLHQSGFFATKWAIEKWSAAAETLRANHPEMKVLAVDINELFRYAVARQDGENPPPLKDANGKVYPDDWIPNPGDFDILCGGPPCQSFSGANSNKTEDDPRSALPFAMLSVAEHYQPQYFVLENVLGLLQHSMRHPANDGHRVEKAMLKLICRGLIALGYQAKPRIMQAGQYGAPQDRQRIIFWGAKRDLKMPESPIPTHACKSARKYKLFLKSDFLPPTRRGRAEGDDHIFAPHAGVTVQDAIGDLPAFDWINPHKIKEETDADVAEVQARRAQGIQQFDPSEVPVGFRNPVRYATEPTTRYQKAMRRRNLKVVANHFTDQQSLFSAELSTQIPLEPLANHKLLPPKFFKGTKLTAQGPDCFGRIDANGRFKTAMTTVAPRSRGSYVLHPTQKRAISVVEAKRGQGFPDDYILMSDEKKESARVKQFYKQIGNAVPVPLAAALGRSLEASIIYTWKQLPREASPALE
ncbi:hypothetical protein B0H17DRAFT_1028224 [Mycena rosella]|uniref:Cytosine-specific methyltransferase n=1 Tax=Mycena rosella TaxID=1033263 RepID=A0AAD7H133_MYCRO|nr:hypothetical protein B0H17DRAFT_1028224 [Mycena rosella]